MKNKDSYINITSDFVSVEINDMSFDILKDIFQFLYWSFRQKEQDNIEVRVKFINNRKDVSKSLYLGLIKTVYHYIDSSIFSRVVFLFKDNFEVEQMNTIKDKVNNSLKKTVKTNKIEFRLIE